MIKSLILICSAAVSSFIYTDIKGENLFFSLFLPLIFIISLIALAIWFVVLFHKNGIDQAGSSGDSGGGSGGYDGGGDC